MGPESPTASWIGGQRPHGHNQLLKHLLQVKITSPPHCPSTTLGFSVSVSIFIIWWLVLYLLVVGVGGGQDGICWFLSPPPFFLHFSKKMARQASSSWVISYLTVWILILRACPHTCVLPMVRGEAACIDSGCLGQRTSPQNKEEHLDIGASPLFTTTWSWEAKSWDFSHF